MITYSQYTFPTSIASTVDRSVYCSSTVSNTMEEALDSLNLFIITAVMIFRLDLLTEVFRNFDFHGEPGLLQFWDFTIDSGCNLMLTDITRNPTRDQGLEDYRKRCFENRYPSVEIPTNVGNWLVGRSAQTGIADHKTAHHVVEQQDIHSEDVGVRGQLVLPVFFNDGDVIKPVGVIEYVTTVRKECYIGDFEQIHNLLKDKGFTSTYMGKTIKVVYNKTMIRFTLPLSAKFADLHAKVVTNRFTELNHQTYRVEYNTTEGIRLPISNDEDLRSCLTESSSRGLKFIKMFVFVEHSR